jgi:hypothetical protein
MGHVLQFSTREWLALLGLSGIKKMCVVSVVASTVRHYGLRSMPQCQIKGLYMHDGFVQGYGMQP